MSLWPSASTPERSRWQDPVAWTVAIFVASIVLQRVSVIPGRSISLSTPIIVAGVLLAWRAGVMRLNRARLGIWVVAAAMSALVVVPQLALVGQAHIALSSWAFWLTVWLPMVMQWRSTHVGDFRRAARAIAVVGLWVSAASVTFMALQLLGFPYRDIVAATVPDALQVKGFVGTYPIEWGSPIVKSNAWVFLEPSFLSFTLGVCAVCAVAARMHPLALVTIMLGIASSVAGSGVAVLFVAFVLVVLTGRVAGLRAHLAWGAALLAIGYLSPLRGLVYDRVGEIAVPGSSSSLRALQPYATLWPHWVSDPLGLLFGYGAGSSRVIVEGQDIPGLIVPNVAKLLFDYGLIAGLALVLALVAAHLYTPYAPLGGSLLFSMLFLQPAVQPLVTCLFLAGTWWATDRRLAGTIPSRQRDERVGDDRVHRLDNASVPTPS